MYNNRRWISHYSRPLKSSKVLIRGVVVATSVATAAAAVANQQLVGGGTIHNDAVPSTAALRSDQTAAPAKKARDIDGDEGLRLPVWGSNRLLSPMPAFLGYSDGLCRAHIISPSASDAPQIRTPAHVFPPGRGAARLGSTRDARCQC